MSEKDVPGQNALGVSHFAFGFAPPKITNSKKIKKFRIGTFLGLGSQMRNALCTLGINLNRSDSVTRCSSRVSKTF
jgi:hypothetical protein